MNNLSDCQTHFFGCRENDRIVAYCSAYVYSSTSYLTHPLNSTAQRPKKDSSSPYTLTVLRLRRRSWIDKEKK